MPRSSIVFDGLLGPLLLLTLWISFLDSSRTTSVLVAMAAVLYNLYVNMMNETLLILSLKTQSLSVDPGHHFTLHNNSPKIFDFLASLHFSGFCYRCYSYGFFSYDSRHGEFFRFAIFKTQFSYTQLYHNKFRLA